MNKEELFNKHITLLALVYYFGGGLMFVSQLNQFLGKHKTQLWREINELNEEGLIDKIVFLKHCVIKIKAYSISKFKEKDHVSSIAVTAYRMQKSAMICAIILKNFKHICKNAEEYLEKAERYTNFVNSENADLYMLSQIQNAMSQKAMQTIELEKEINETEHLKFDNYKKHLNIYIEKYGKRKPSEFVFSIAILDLSSIIPILMSKRISDMFYLCDSIFQNSLKVEGRYSVHYDFTFYVRDEYRQKYILKQVEKVNQSLKEMKFDSSMITLNVENLNITSSVFSNQIIFL